MERVQEAVVGAGVDHLVARRAATPRMRSRTPPARSCAARRPPAGSSGRCRPAARDAGRRRSSTPVPNWQPRTFWMISSLSSVAVGGAVSPDKTRCRRASDRPTAIAGSPSPESRERGVEGHAHLRRSRRHRGVERARRGRGDLLAGVPVRRRRLRDRAALALPDRRRVHQRAVAVRVEDVAVGGDVEELQVAFPERVVVLRAGRGWCRCCRRPRYASPARWPP